jgi:hypothetical protein
MLPGIRVPEQHPAIAGLVVVPHPNLLVLSARRIEGPGAVERPRCEAIERRGRMARQQLAHR